MSAHVLILDADPVAAQITGAFVQRCVSAATVAYASTPEQAWQSIQRLPPDLLVVDPAPGRLATTWLIQAVRQHPYNGASVSPVQDPAAISGHASVTTPLDV